MSVTLVRMIMDVDTGVDDALALALAVRHPRIQLEAVTTVAGNVGLDLTTRNTLTVLEWLQAGDIPVAAGADRPLSGEVREASHFHGADGLGGAQLPPASRAASDNGVQELIERLTAEPGQITLVCTGPLTNLALAIKREYAVVAAAKEVVLMGGAARPPGNVTPVAEFNIYADPDAAAVVFSQNWRVTMVGLDVTNHVRLTRAERDALRQPGRGQASREAVLVREVTRHLFDARGLEAMALHDPLAVGVALEPDLVGVSEREVHVETRGEHTLGQTVVDFRAVAAPDVKRRVCTSVDAERFRHMFFETLGLGAP